MARVDVLLSILQATVTVSLAFSAGIYKLEIDTSRPPKANE